MFGNRTERLVEDDDPGGRRAHGRARHSELQCFGAIRRRRSAARARPLDVRRVAVPVMVRRAPGHSDRSCPRGLWSRSTRTRLTSGLSWRTVGARDESEVVVKYCSADNQRGRPLHEGEALMHSENAGHVGRRGGGRRRVGRGHGHACRSAPRWRWALGPVVGLVGLLGASCSASAHRRQASTSGRAGEGHESTVGHEDESRRALAGAREALVQRREAWRLARASRDDRCATALRPR